MTGLKSRLLAGCGLCLVFLFVNCAGDLERTAIPTAPGAAATVRHVETSGPGDFKVEGLDGLEEIDTAAVAVNLSGTWSGTKKPGGSNPKVSVKFTHSGTRLTGVALGVPKGLTGTFDLKQKSATKTSRTFQGTLRITTNGDGCPKLTIKPTTMVVNIAVKPMTMTGSSKGHDPDDCNDRSETFALKKVQ